MSNMSLNLGKETVKIGLTVILSTILTLGILNFALKEKKIPCNVTPQPSILTEKSSVIDENDIIADIAEKLMPSVVHITTETEQIISGYPESFFFQDDFFQKFFGFDGMNENPAERMPLKRKTSGTGSGTIISSDGYILTNYHVVQNASKISVKLKDGKVYTAKLVGKDPYSDLAVIKINEKNLMPAKLSDSATIRPGQWAIAIGSPQGLDHTVTLGIISAVSREIPELSNVSFLQTDAAINPGNSGGPLLNIKGEVVGINTAIIGTAQNIGFAIPVNTAKKIIGQLKAGETIGHPWIGIAMSLLNPETALSLGLPKNTSGILINKVMPGSPAEEAGLQAGDILQRINGKKYNSPEDIQNAIKDKKVNDIVNIQILRDGSIMSKKVKLGNWGESKTAPRPK